MTTPFAMLIADVCLALFACAANIGHGYRHDTVTTSMATLIAYKCLAASARAAMIDHAYSDGIVTAPMAMLNAGVCLAFAGGPELRLFAMAIDTVL